MYICLSLVVTDGPLGLVFINKLPNFQTITEKLVAVEETEVVVPAEKCSAFGLVRFCLTLCGISEGTVDSQIEIPVEKRKAFLTETSMRVRTWNKFLAILLIATIAFLIGYFK